MCEKDEARATNSVEDNIQALTDKLGQMQKAINEAMITCANAGTTVLSPEQLLQENAKLKQQLAEKDAEIEALKKKISDAKK